GTVGTTNLFHCPMDKDNSFRKTQSQPYDFSYELTTYDFTSIASVGFGTIIDTSDKAHYFKTTSVRNPAGKILVPEPVAAVTSVDAPPPDLKTGWAMVSGRWEPFHNGAVDNYLTCRHSGDANCGFADGHAELVKWQFGTNQMNSNPGF
ncbi:MAG TPA: hypothetical protein VGV18_00350, partial [Verrucomicrobiae bacterium]|nr:hypothetical protein [Verrucomicrobiae bacterium]